MARTPFGVVGGPNPSALADHIQTYVLQRVPILLGMTQRIDALDTARFDVRESALPDAMAETLSVRLAVFLLGKESRTAQRTREEKPVKEEKTVVDQTFSFPKTWWDAVKKRFVPERFQKGWFSVQMETIDAITSTYTTVRKTVHESNTYVRCCPSPRNGASSRGFIRSGWTMWTRANCWKTSTPRPAPSKC